MNTALNEWPFGQWQQIAVRRFHLSPSDFWAMPVQDWLLLLSGLKAGGLDRADLSELLILYPDVGDKHE